MFGIDPLTLSSMLVLAGNITCPAHAPTKINIIPRTQEVKYDHSQSLKKIQNYSTDTVDPYGFHGQTITQGFMNGQIMLEHKIQYGQLTNSKYNYACIWYKDITVEIKIDPSIVIAKELYRDKCMRNAILGHELKHVRVDREIVNKYARAMGAKLMSALKSRGFEAGPMRMERMQEVSAKIAIAQLQTASQAMIASAQVAGQIASAALSVMNVSTSSSQSNSTSTTNSSSFAVSLSNNFTTINSV